VGSALDAGTAEDVQVPVDAGLADLGTVADAGHLADAASGSDAALPVDGGSNTDGGPEAPPACAYRRFSPPDDYALFALESDAQLHRSIGEGPRTLEFWLPNLEPPAEGSERIDEVSLSTMGFDRMAGRINMSAFVNSQGRGTQYVGVWEPPENFDLQSPAHVVIVYDPDTTPVLRFYLRGQRQQLSVSDQWQQGCSQQNVIAGARCGGSGQVRTTATRLGPLRLSSVASLYVEDNHPVPEFELGALDSTVLLLSPTSMEIGAWTDLSGTGRHGTVSGAPECYGGIEKNGSSERTAALSCKAIKDEYPNSPSAAYWLDPDGGGEAPAYRVWCDMEYNGGGWQLVTIISNANDQILDDDNYYAFRDGEYVAVDPVNSDARGSLPLAQPFTEVMVQLSELAGWHLRYVASSNDQWTEWYRDHLAGTAPTTTLSTNNRNMARELRVHTKVPQGQETDEGQNFGYAYCFSNSNTSNQPSTRHRLAILCTANTTNTQGSLNSFQLGFDKEYHDLANLPGGTSGNYGGKILFWVR